ncbi:MAG: hypothetical protein A2Y10_13325 [Planctomycetes bacterium GWF2_41_51]|nr:MAG: hypothetical protein A2Y10_13325 [Planctomycetes bacterium GWF2_41_51]HBG26285.1 hypothetical protein [Phycisphaerales bacterium]
MTKSVNPPVKVHTLHSPALHWTEGHILGNGDLGAIVWGTPDSLKIGFSKHDVNDLRHPDKDGTYWKRTYPEVRKMAMEGDISFRKKGWELNKNNPYRYGQQQISCGQLELNLMNKVQPVSFKQQLSFEKAEILVNVEPTPRAANWAIEYKPLQADFFIPDGENVLIAELDSQTTQVIDISYKRFNSEYIDPPSYSVGCSKNLGIMRHLLPENVAYAVCVKVVGGKSDISANDFGINGYVKFGGELGKVCILIGAISSYESKVDLFETQADKLMDRVQKVGIETIKQNHYRWWDNFWSKSTISHECKSIEKLWTMALYAMASSTRADKSSPNLQGIWVQDEISPWHADYHFNTNVQECQWMPCKANHPELQAALVKKLTDDWKDILKKYARDNFESDGLAVPFNADWSGRPIAGIPLALETSVTAWTSQHVWWQYLYTQDKKLLSEKVYPFLRGCAQLYIDILIKDSRGQYNIELTHSPEQYWFEDDGEYYQLFGRNSAIDIASITALFDYVCKAADILEQKDELIEKCKDIKANLPSLPSLDGFLIDYEEAFFHDGKRAGWIPQSHRHPSRLMAIFPAKLLGLHSDTKEFEFAKRSFLEFHRRYGQQGFCGWSWSYQACIAANLGMSEIAENCLLHLYDRYMFKGLLSSISKIHIDGDDPNSLYDECSDAGPIFQIEALFGAGAAIQEMLVQRTADDVIRCFPAVAKGRKASFKDLRVPGAVLVEAEHDGSEVKYIKVTPECNGPLKVLNPWEQMPVTVSSDGQIFASEHKIIMWNGLAGKTYKLVKSI